ncbi:MAG: ferredoxin [Alphaproteobacteria bacterium CG_4_10_14_0_2_um_filter_63_37]|nr:MAG: ferredoxin [Proteobacteria bacterium CG1_02_64_396]PJA25178.1 MAG: ferredoxin [Alphaproteobacteria bacterium CG_4_10_14_0_2_um_filter_63_37]
MAMQILRDDCIDCGVCEPDCPSDAIFQGKVGYEIDPEACTECEGAFDKPKCVEECPISGCIVKL